ncbi:hypothetical protein E1263_30565 [Kribbella antibiotica]|uniref:Uncharacterized protein n=1 Tax=Kribbella antibiotica TaxID=190195 RepID=A0A4R4Z4B1_9ACTN|nr:hypothetical protein [Kribbella antibiotica]TDD50902.1 hypothetical protein E1263_30565 [Kribbella antibiotica]
MVQTQSSPPVSPFVEPWRPSPRAKTVIALVAAGVVVLCAATYVVQRVWLTPEAAVEGYFGALEDRDATKAASYIKDSNTSISDILKSEQYVPPTKLKVDKVEGDDAKTAKVSFFIGDKQVSGEIPLHHKEKLTLGLFRGWGINGDRPSIQISAAAPVDVQVNGKPLPEDAKESRLLQVFPGRYVVSVAENQLLESTPITVDAGFGENEVTLEPRIKATAQSAAEAQVKEYLNGCVTKNVETCPFTSSITKPVWKIDTYPTLELRIGDDGAVVVETKSSGKATVTGTGYGGYPVNDQPSFTVAGLLIVEQGKLKFQPES